MVDKEARKELAIRLHHLVSGEMTNDEFDCHYERWEDSNDPAVAEIATFGYGVYSSGLGTYRLKGSHAGSVEDRELASRAILFLNTGLEYEWPRGVRQIVPYWCLWGPGCYFLIGMLFLFVALV